MSQTFNVDYVGHMLNLYNNTKSVDGKKAITDAIKLYIDISNMTAPALNTQGIASDAPSRVVAGKSPAQFSDGMRQQDRAPTDKEVIDKLSHTVAGRENELRNVQKILDNQRKHIEDQTASIRHAMKMVAEAGNIMAELNRPDGVIDRSYVEGWLMRARDAGYISTLDAAP